MGEKCSFKWFVKGGEDKGEKTSGLRGRSSSRFDGGKHPSKCKWFNLPILANLCLL
jgi:hypothetical protein